MIVPMARGRALVAAAASGALLALSLPSYDLWPLAWFGLVPLLLAIRGRTPAGAFGVAWVGWLVFSLLALYWIAPTISNFTSISRPLSIGVLILLCMTSAVYVGVFGAALEWIAAAGISRVLAAPCLWVVVEWTRTFFPAAFPWALLGYSQYRVLPVVQIADLFAIYGVTAVLVFVNAGLAEIVRDGVRRHASLATAMILLVASVVGYGAVRLSVIDARAPTDQLEVGVAQGNIPQDEKWDPENEDTTLVRYLELSDRAAAAGARLIVWPEAAVPFFLGGDRRAIHLARLSDRTGTWLLVGAPGYERRDDGVARQYNQAWMVAPDNGLVGAYDKIELVPFGEYIPFGFLTSWVGTAVETVGQFGRGVAPVVFDGPPMGAGDRARPVGVGPLICYEGIFPDLTRRFVADGADVLVNISNDAWYGRTSAPYQHLAMAAVRAIENRVPLVRATNTGISALVDPSGRIRARTALFETAVFVDSVGVGGGGSLYTRIGDVLVYAMIGAIAVLAYLRIRLGSVLIRGDAPASEPPA